MIEEVYLWVVNLMLFGLGAEGIEVIVPFNAWSGCSQPKFKAARNIARRSCVTCGCGRPQRSRQVRSSRVAIVWLLICPRDITPDWVISRRRRSYQDVMVSGLQRAIVTCVDSLAFVMAVELDWIIIPA